jgi:hypothetical protein
MKAWQLLLSLALALGVVSTAAFGGAAPPQKAPDGKEAEEELEVEGVEIARANGTFLGLAVRNNNFVLGFYDEEKKPVRADMVSATLRWPVRYQPNDERTVLRVGGDGTVLTSGFVIRQPHSFRVTILLFAEGRQDSAETYTVEYRGE